MAGVAAEGVSKTVKYTHMNTSKQHIFMEYTNLITVRSAHASCLPAFGSYNRVALRPRLVYKFFVFD